MRDEGRRVPEPSLGDFTLPTQSTVAEKNDLAPLSRSPASGARRGCVVDTVTSSARRTVDVSST